MSVFFPVPAEVAFDYLVDPRNRPGWQSSLRRVDRVSPAEPAVGQTWVDVTAVGARPTMETTVLDRPSVWTERGTWRAITAELTLVIEPEAGGCTVRAEATVRGPLVGRLLSRLAPYAIEGDLRRAARILSERSASE